LPTRSKDGWLAADAWALFAADEDGKAIASEVHRALKGRGIWVWSSGCIEQVTGTVEKGEDAIIAQEKKLQGLSAEDLARQMPLLPLCFDWIRAV
jgi:putative ATP-dependent endonuclease of the OLD family